jgi:thymidine phosphorylase
LFVPLGGNLLVSKGKAGSTEEGFAMVQKSLTNGTALQKFQEMLVAQNVAADVAKKLCDPKTDLWEILPIEKRKMELTAESDGVVLAIDAFAIANVLAELGAGRLKPKDKVNHGVGMVLKTRKGGCLKKGQVWAVLYHAEALKENHLADLKRALKIGEQGDGVEKPIESRIIDIIKPNL